MEMNYIPGNTLSEKAVSAFPLSIGTSLAFESVFMPMQDPYDPKRVIPDRLEVTDHQTCWVNLTTLFRNLSGAISKETFLAATPQSLAAALEEEIDVIQGLFQNEGQNLCKVNFYYSTYEKLTKRNIPGLSFREPNTEAQKHYHNVLLGTLKLMEKHSDSIHRFDDSLSPTRREKAFVLTHHPYDLVDYDRFSDLVLLESNTGAVKPRSRWNSKYYSIPGESFVHLPFFKKILLILGDRVQIKPMPLSFRKQVLETSIKRNWTVATTLPKIKMDLEFDIKDPYAIAIINSL